MRCMLQSKASTSHQQPMLQSTAGSSQEQPLLQSTTGINTVFVNIVWKNGMQDNAKATKIEVAHQHGVFHCL